MNLILCLLEITTNLLLQLFKGTSSLKLVRCSDDFHPRCLNWSKLSPDYFSFFVDLLSSELIPQVLGLVKSCLASNNGSVTEELLESRPDAVFWLRLMGSIKDPYTTERISEQILHKLETQHVDDVQAYWVLWLLFHRIIKLQASVRSVEISWFCLCSYIILNQSSNSIWIEGKKTDKLWCMKKKLIRKAWADMNLNFLIISN